MKFDQELADELDKALLAQPLPEDAVASLARWLADPDRGGRYARGTASHGIDYLPSSWTAVEPWPASLADRSVPGPRTVTRGDVTAVAVAASRSENWAEAFVASQVWGYGRRGYGPGRTRTVLDHSWDGEVFDWAVSLLRREGPVVAYEKLNGVHRLGPAFLTKFLYFAGLVLPEAKGLPPLILDMRLARVLRRHATNVGHDAGHDWAAPIAARIWRDGGWTSHRYDVYLRWMHAINSRLTTEVNGWPASPDILELALFASAWHPQVRPPGAAR
ncbi:8-oxoguanine DNA glycosylase OGG fold protein [Streptomyces misionensis]|uniref:8-oxoguanine DNA glycosylase OGG fold protein n=1 Tax=Streptomyces misionensis TaxID=67331 RepID=UPI0033A88766